MNFEFIQNIKGLKELYTPCKDAEDLAVSKPYLSMTAARKSAEALAHYIYLQAYKEEARNMNFVDILSDYVVKRYINSRFVLDALHHIRKCGNSAVHGEINQTADQAIELLEDLHYAVGETAKREHLIRTYPHFSTDVAEHPDAEFHDFDPVKLAEDMAAENIAKYKAEKLMEEYSDFCSPVDFVPGEIDLNECVEWTVKPVLSSTIPLIQSYFGHLAMKTIKYQYGESDHQYELKFNAIMTTYGKHARTTSGLFEFMDCLMHDISDADGFKIESYYEGPGFAGKIDNEVEFPFFCSCKFDETDEGKNVIYKCFRFLYNHGEGSCMKFDRGQWLALEDQNISGAVLDKDFGQNWWSWNIDLYLVFDFEKHPEILQSLQNIVRKYIPADQLEYCEDSWDGEEYQILVNSISWDPVKLRVVQDFLDEINAVIEPIKNECNGDTSGEWYITQDPMATAQWRWNQDHFEIIGGKL